MQNLGQSNPLGQKTLETNLPVNGFGTCTSLIVELSFYIVREMITNPSRETGRAGKGCSVVNMPHYWKM